MTILAAIFLSIQAASLPEPAIGATWAIAEPDALAEVEAAADGKSVSLRDFGDSDEWAATESTILSVATVNRIREVIPFYTLPFDIPDGKGGILYPRGFTFNPLEHLRMPGALWIVGEREVDWAIEKSAPEDMIIMAGGNALKASDAKGVSLYALQPVLVERLGLKAAPALVWQEGSVLKIQEFAADRLPADVAAPIRSGALTSKSSIAIELEESR